MTAGRAGHPDVESLDAYAGGERRDLAVDRHVRDCPDCVEAVAALRRVRSDLARLSDLTMPDDVAGRIRDALAADARSRPPRHPSDRRGPFGALTQDGRTAGGPGGPAPVRSAGPGPFASPKRRGPGAAGWRPRAVGSPREWLVAAVCLLAVVAVGVVVSDRGGTTTASVSGEQADEQTALSAPRAATDATAEDSSGSSAGGGAGADDSPAASAAPQATPLPTGQAVAPLEAPTDAAAQPPTTVSTSETVLADSGFTRHANDVLAQPTTARSAVVAAVNTFVFAGTADISASAWSTLTSRAAARCYDSLVSRSGGGLLAVDQVRYLGGQALFVVLTAPGDPASVVVVVVDADCAHSADASSPLRTVTVERL